MSDVTVFSKDELEDNTPYELSGPSHIKKHIRVPLGFYSDENANVILKDFCVTWVGFYEKAYEHIVPPRILKDEYQIMYCVEGRGHLVLSGVKYEVSAGDMIFYLKGEAHSYHADAKNPWTVYWVGFSGEHSEHYLALLRVTQHSPIIHVGVDDLLAKHFVEIISVLDFGCFIISLLHATTCLRYILSRMIDIRFDSKLTFTSTATTNSIIEVMHVNINRMMTLDELAYIVGMSKYHLSRRFKKSTGYSPLKYFMRLKIQRACELLMISGSKVKDVSEALGFSTPYHFSEVFKKHTGVSPSSFKDMLR